MIFTWFAEWDIISANAPPWKNKQQIWCRTANYEENSGQNSVFSFNIPSQSTIRHCVVRHQIRMSHAQTLPLWCPLHSLQAPHSLPSHHVMKNSQSQIYFQGFLWMRLPLQSHMWCFAFSKIWAHLKCMMGHGRCVGHSISFSKFFKFPKGKRQNVTAPHLNALSLIFNRIAYLCIVEVTLQHVFSSQNQYHADYFAFRFSILNPEKVTSQHSKKQYLWQNV